MPAAAQKPSTTGGQIRLCTRKPFCTRSRTAAQEVAQRVGWRCAMTEYTTTTASQIRSLASNCSGVFTSWELTFGPAVWVGILSDRYKLPAADPKSNNWRYPRPLHESRRDYTNRGSLQASQGCVAMSFADTLVSSSRRGGSSGRVCQYRCASILVDTLDVAMQGSARLAEAARSWRRESAIPEREKCSEPSDSNLRLQALRTRGARCPVCVFRCDVGHRNSRRARARTPNWLLDCLLVARPRNVVRNVLDRGKRESSRSNGSEGSHNG